MKMAAKSMKAVVWEGKPFEMRVKDVPMPQIQDPNDVVIQLTTTAICGTDLHTYRGLFGSRPPFVMGHEGIGTVVHVGSGIKSLAVGDLVLAGPIISCGYCDNCIRGRLSFCLTFNPKSPIDSIGLGEDLGLDLGGAQAQYIRIPFADSSCLKLPANAAEHALDYILVADVFPTGWFALDSSGFQPGDSVAVFGAGPIGLMCVYSAILRGASKVYSVDYVPARLAKAASMGAIPINFLDSDPVAQIMAREPSGVRRSCDCVGFEALNSDLKLQEDIVLNQCVQVTDFTGGIGVVGLYLPPTGGPTPGAPLSTGKGGTFPVPVGLMWTKALSISGGPAELRRLQPQLRDLVQSGKAKPSVIIDEVLDSLDDLPAAYKKFEARLIIKPVVRLPHPHSVSAE